MAMNNGMSRHDAATLLVVVLVAKTDAEAFHHQQRLHTVQKGTLSMLIHLGTNGKHYSFFCPGCRQALNLKG